MRPWLLLVLLLIPAVAGPTRAGDDPVRIRARLAALEEARAAGILSDAEYAAKKKELEAALDKLEPALDEETRRKLAALEAARDAGVLTPEEYARKRAEILGRARPAATPTEPPSDGWAVYRHPLGVSLRHPPDWRVRLQNGVPLLVPPDAAMENGAPAEIYFAFDENLEGIDVTRPDDPRVIRHLDTQLKSLAPALTRKGDAVAAKASGGPAGILDWEAPGTDGRILLARCYVVISSGHALALVGLGAREHVLRRDPVLRRILATVGIGAPGELDPSTYRGKAGDPLIVGVWLHEKHFGTDTFSSSTIRTFAFRADGTFVTQGQYAAATEIETTGSQVSRRVGGWTAEKGSLTLQWADGETVTVRYHLEDPSQPGTTAATMGKRLMLVTTPDGKKTLWTHRP